MNFPFGVNVHVNDLLQDEPKLKFHWPEETPTMQEFNRWLAERFGHKLTFYRVGDVIVTNRRGYMAIQEAIKEQA